MTGIRVSARMLGDGEDVQSITSGKGLLPTVPERHEATRQTKTSKCWGHG